MRANRQQRSQCRHSSKEAKGGGGGSGKLTRQSGTMNLFNHLKTRHKLQYLEVVGGKQGEDASKPAAGTKSVSTFFKGSKGGGGDVIETFACNGNVQQ